METGQEAATVQDGVTISHRGRSYEIGRGPGFYGIWHVRAPGSQPIEWWPQTQDGWRAAWSRFTGIEAPDALTLVSAGTMPSIPVPDPAAKPGGLRLIAPVVLIAGVVCGIAGLFIHYLGPQSLAQQSMQLVPHAIYIAAWTVSAILLLLGGDRARFGALVGLGTSAVTFGLLFADLGTVISGGAGLAGTGLWLSLIGWLACSAGSVLALILSRPGAPARPRGRDEVLAVLLAGFAALGAAIAFAPSWDSYTLRTSNGLARSFTAGNAFANPAPVITGDVAVMVAIVAAVVAAALWQPGRRAAALAAGATMPLVAQAISAIVQVGEPASSLQFGISPEIAARIGLTITSGLTPAFWVYCAFLLALVLLCARMLTAPGPVPPAPVGMTTALTADADGEISGAGNTPWAASPIRNG
ncbi:MAG TPA: hypothetical protein VFQ44_27895 [Streptosporangiaceae bacterium]|nr:hypothetical protein [Streptosporangiaceae bacterium]